jgi:probable F420-dependent oxidoreductase
MRISMTMPVEDPRQAGTLFAELEAAGYDGAFSFESSHDPFIPLAVAAGSTTTMRLGTAVAIGFARNPMVLANLGYDLQLLTEGRFVLGLGSQIKPHIEKRFSETWSRPAARMREMVLAIRAIWAAWEGEAKLDFQGEFYRHTIMTPAFDPGPNPFGRPPIMIGGFGPKMIEVAGEVADGMIVHPFNTRQSLEQLVLPALERGAAKAGRAAADLELLWVTMVVTWCDEAERAAAMLPAKAQLAFYGSTPAYARVLDLHGFGDLHPELNRLSKQGDWLAMAELIPDELVEQIAVVGPRDEIAAKVAARVDGITDSVGLVNNRNPDPAHFADVVAALRTLSGDRQVGPR